MQSNKFYRDNVHVGDFFIARLNGTVRVVKCTKVYDHIANNDSVTINRSYTFKPDVIVHEYSLDGKMYICSGHGTDFTILEKIEDEKMKDTSIYFTDKSTYRKRVNRDKWIELKYEIADLKGRGDK